MLERRLDGVVRVVFVGAHRGKVFGRRDGSCGQRLDGLVALRRQWVVRRIDAAVGQRRIGRDVLVSGCL